MLHDTSAAAPGNKPVCPGDFAPAGMRRMDLETEGGGVEADQSGTES